MDKTLKLLAVLLIAGSMLSPAAFAKNENARDSLVALGDSIPFGYNLGMNNQHPSKEAYPFEIGEEADVRVRNLAVPGAQTEGLLDALQHSQKYRQAIQHADYVTVSIISNDLLTILRAAVAESEGDSVRFQELLAAKLAEDDAFASLAAILQEIRTLTDAPIVLFNVYNPFQVNDSFHQVADSVLPLINGRIAQLSTAFSDVYIADAYSEFGNNQAEYVIMGDIHPTEEGQEVLAELALEALGFE
ncbi:GDSL-type esterase/lipase family protein [Indiicoccus explosivorum]|uniref:GDSL-type esterase/lipase family protein n=1 Tax=Indiicoccus explosivorum TaxID=1917864 RepID=UPI001F4EB4F6|nr:GDSL-type esterase/lipase family protein [Indiicoccus explosivorum]